MFYKRIISLIFVQLSTCLVLATSFCSNPDPSPHVIYFPHNSTGIYWKCEDVYVGKGEEVLRCVNNKFIDPKPVCMQPGCSQVSVQVPHGTVSSDDYQTWIECEENYTLSGNYISHCNGTHWDRPLGKCLLDNKEIKLECDFETEKLCGWYDKIVQDLQWKRETAMDVFGSFSAGPTHDHTLQKPNNGYYMVMRSWNKKGLKVPLISPLYEKDLSLNNTCFRFYYYMYGEGVGSLSVYIKPDSVGWEELFNNTKYLVFKKSGPQEKSWQKGVSVIPELEENFRIVFVAKSSSTPLSDIAIDDFKILNGTNCTDSQISIIDLQTVDEEEELEYANDKKQNNEKIYKFLQVILLSVLLFIVVVLTTLRMRRKIYLFYQSWGHKEDLEEAEETDDIIYQNFKVKMIPKTELKA